MQLIPVTPMPTAARPSPSALTEKSVSLAFAGLLAVAAICVALVRTPPPVIADAPVAPFADGLTITALR